jgi:O-antigen/teichoic acid export membrane protein
VAVPVIVRGLGVERFGVLVLAWTLLGYLAVFDLGVGRATVRFAAQRLAGRDDAGFRSVVWTSLAVNAALGVLGGVLLALATPLLVET